MKFILLAVLLAIVETAPPIPGQAPDSAASTTKKVQKQPNSDQPNSANAPTPDISKATPDEKPKGNDKDTKDSQQSVRVTELPSVSISAKRDWFDRSSLAFNFLLLLVAALQVVLTCLTIRLIRRQAVEMTRQRVLMGGQLKEMQGQLRQMRIASDQTDRLIDQGRETNRPWLLIPMGTEFSDIGQPLLPESDDPRICHVPFMLKNYGRSPARIASQKVRLYVGDSENVSPKWKPFADDGTVREDYTVAQKSVHRIEAHLEYNGRISPQDRTAVREATRFLWLCGFIRYRDASDLDESGILYETRICYIWKNNTTRYEPFWVMGGPREYNRCT
jgi:hypothetical protein